MLEDDLDQVNTSMRTELRNGSPAQSDDSGFHGHEQSQHNGHNGTLYRNGTASIENGYVSVFAQHAKSSSSSIFDDMDKRLLQRYDNHIFPMVRVVRSADENQKKNLREVRTLQLLRRKF